MRGLRIGDKVKSKVTGEEGKIFDIKRKPNSRDIELMGVAVNWYGDEGTTTWQYEEDLILAPKTVYYVIDTTPEIQSDGFYQKSLGTHTTKGDIYSTQKVLYEGTNPIEANRIYRQSNRGNRFDDEHNTMIYKGFEDEERAVLHKV